MMPLFRVRNTLLKRGSEGQELVVRGNQILFVSKSDVSLSDSKGGKRSTTNSAPHGAKLLCSKFSKVSLDEVVRGQFIHGTALRREKLKLRKTTTVDCGIQVNDIEDEQAPEELANESARAVEKEIQTVKTEHPKEEESASTINNRRFTNMKNTAECLDTSDHERGIAATLQEKELLFAHQLKVLADGCNIDPLNSLELKDSTYVVVKEPRGILVVNFPQDLQSEDNPDFSATGLLEAFDVDDDDDDLDLTPQNSLPSTELLSSESNCSSPVHLARRKTLYPEPCPAFPMEVSFPPVDFH